MKGAQYWLSDNFADLPSWGAQFEFQTAHRLSWQRFVSFLSVPVAKCLNISRLTHDRFLACLLQFITPFTLCFLGEWQHRQWNHRKRNADGQCLCHNSTKTVIPQLMTSRTYVVCGQTQHTSVKLRAQILGLHAGNYFGLLNDYDRELTPRILWQFGSKAPLNELRTRKLALRRVPWCCEIDWSVWTFWSWHQDVWGHWPERA